MSELKIMEKADWDLLMKLRTKTRFHANDISQMAYLYEKYINVRLKRIVDWTCPFCVKECRDQLITFQSGAVIKEDLEAAEFLQRSLEVESKKIVKKRKKKSDEA